MTLDIKWRRPDGSFVAVVRGLDYHVTPDDPLFADAQAAGATAPLEPAAPALTPAELRSVLRLTFAQLLIGLVTEGWITEAEGEGWLAGTLPAMVLGVIAGLPASAQFAARARAARPSVIDRMDPLVGALAVVAGKDDGDLDDFFTTYALV